jgi:phytoene desaturase
MKKRIVVIGSGFGGLSVAIRLQAAGFQVTIIEKRDQVGGCASQIEDTGYTFDTGPSLITAPSLFKELFEIAGRNFDSYVTLIPLDPFYRVFFENPDPDIGKKFTQVDYTGNPEQMKNELEKLEVGSGKNYDAYFKKIGKIYEVAYKKLGAKPFLTFGDFVSLLPDMFRLDAMRSVSSNAKSFFKTDLLQRMYSFHPLYMGTNPHHAPGAVSFIPYLEREEGVWYAKGGMYSVVKALAKLFQELGGEVITGEKITRIETAGKIATHIIGRSKTYACDLVISNADIINTLLMMSSVDEKAVKKFKKAHYSMSLYMLYLGVKKQYHDKLAHHTLILSSQYEELLKEIYQKKVIPSSLSLYLHIPTITDPTMAPEGCESLYVLVPMPHLGSGIEWTNDLSNTIRDRVIDYLENTLGLDDLRSSIEVEHRFIPTSFENDLGTYLGAAFSTELSLLQSTYFRQHNRSDEIDNLYFVGSGTHPGPGVPGVLKSAECTASLVLRDTI